MRIPRIYQENNLLTAKSPFPLSPDAFQHLIKVLRCKIGHQIELFDGQGNQQSAQICTVEKKSATIELIGSPQSNAASALPIHLGQVLSKGERMDYALQKSVELGVSEITPLFSERCDVKLPSDRVEKKLQHWRKVVISACEQCRQNWLPTVNAPMNIEDWIKQSDAEIKLAMHTATQESKSLLDQSLSPKSVAVLVGPEGGLSSTEVEQAEVSGFSALQLGPRVFRTETAPVVALSLLQMVWGDF